MGQKPPIWWVEPPSEGIHQVLRQGMQDRGWPVGGPNSPIVVFSAGDPFWTEQRYDSGAMERVLGDLATRVVVVEKHEYGWSNYFNPAIRRECAWMGTDHYGATCDVSGGTHRSKHMPMLNFVHALIDQIPRGRKLLYFRREYFRDQPYPPYVHPINFAVGSIPPIPSFESWMARKWDVVCVWGETHDHRRIIANALREAIAKGYFTGEVRSPVYAGDHGRLGGGETYRQFHENGRIFIESDGHGLGGGRSWELITTLAMARKRSWMIVRDDWFHGHTCLEFGSPEDPQTEQMVETIRQWVNSPKDLYELFVRGHNHAGQWHHNGGNAAYLERLMTERGWY